MCIHEDQNTPISEEVSSTANVHWLLKVNTARLETYWTVAMARQNKYVYSLAQTAMCVCNSVSRYLAHKATIEKSGFNSQLPHCHGITASAWATLLYYFLAYSPHMWKSQNAPKWVPRQHKLKKRTAMSRGHRIVMYTAHYHNTKKCCHWSP